LDLLKIVDKYNDREVQALNVTSIPISAAVTAYGRIHITKIKLDILKSGGKIYYSDTDSIVTDICLPNNMVDPTSLGKLKLEHMVNKGVFISGKTYCIIDNNGLYINRAKGVDSSSLSYNDYIKLLNNTDISTASKTQSKTN